MSFLYYGAVGAGVPAGLLHVYRVEFFSRSSCVGQCGPGLLAQTRYLSSGDCKRLRLQ